MLSGLNTIFGQISKGLSGWRLGFVPDRAWPRYGPGHRLFWSYIFFMAWLSPAAIMPRSVNPCHSSGIIFCVTTHIGLYSDRFARQQAKHGSPILQFVFGGGFLVIAKGCKNKNTHLKKLLEIFFIGLQTRDVCCSLVEVMRADEKWLSTVAG